MFTFQSFLEPLIMKLPRTKQPPGKHLLFQNYWDDIKIHLSVQNYLWCQSLQQLLFTWSKDLMFLHLCIKYDRYFRSWPSLNWYPTLKCRVVSKGNFILSHNFNGPLILIQYGNEYLDILHFIVLFVTFLIFE